MSDYNFDTLNDSDFEEFVNDLLSKILKKKVERFKKGRDKGIDGRLSHVDGTDIIIQSKHYIGSSFSTLKSHLINKERPKLDKLNQIDESKDIRYIFATSQGLNSSEVDELVTIFHPFLKVEDIYWKQKLNDCLKDFPEVEKTHYKLWLQSSNVLQNLLNRDIDFHSESELERIRNTAKVYTKTKLHDKAKSKLDKEQCLIIVGAPGVGKTTLARMLCNDYLIEQSKSVHDEDEKEDFEFVFVESGMRGASKKFIKGKSQIFLFDDFLGRNYLSAIKNNLDSEVVRFIERVKRDPTKRFILTSRVTILNQGRLRSKELKTDKVNNAQFIFDANELEDIDRARILYNHLFFAKSPEHRFYDHITELYKDDRYKTIISHKNYNPRVIEFILAPAELAKVEPSKYWEFVLKNLMKPDEVWELAIKEQLGNLEQVILWFVTFSNKIPEEALRTAVEEYFDRRQKSLNVYDFTDALKTLSDAFLHKVIWHISGKSYWSLSNPSIADYVSPTLINEHTTVLIEIVIALGKNLSFRALPSASRIYSVQNSLLGGTEFWRKLLNYLQSNSLAESHLALTMLALENCLRGHELHCKNYRTLIDDIFKLYSGEHDACTYSVGDLELLLGLSMELKGKHSYIDWDLICSKCLNDVISHDELVDFSRVYDNIEYSSGYAVDLLDDLTNKALGFWYDDIEVHISDQFDEGILTFETEIVDQYRNSGELDEEACKDVIENHVQELIEQIESEYESNISIVDDLMQYIKLDGLYKIALDSLDEYVEDDGKSNFVETKYASSSLFESEDEEDDEDDEDDDEIESLFSER